MASNTMNILYLDKEGGYGGSGRSLYFLLRHLDRSRFVPFVIAGEDGPNRKRYAALGVAWCRENIPAYKPGKRKNVLALLLFFTRFYRFLGMLARLGQFIRKHEIDLIHLNHDGFFTYAMANHWLWYKPVIQHVRTMIPTNFFGRWQCTKMYRYSNRLIFITERERERFAQLCGKPLDDPKFAVITNIAETPDNATSVVPEWMADLSERFIVLWMGNIAYSKGSDRLVAIAREWKISGWRDGVIVACGIQRNIGSAKDDLMDGMKELIRDEGLENWIRFAGFQEDTAPILQRCRILIRVTRENDPWGRDVIEAVSVGKPVLATGSSSPYIQSGETGILFPEFDPRTIARTITGLAQNPEEYRRLAANTRERFKDAFSGRLLAPQVEAIYAESSHAPSREK